MQTYPSYKSLILIPLMLLFYSCQTAYYKTMEQFGYHKRDILVSSVEDARESQEDAKEQFQSALETFTEVLDFRGGDLQEKYEKLNSQFESSEARAELVRDRVDDVEDVAEALFDEWESELDKYSDEKLRNASEDKLRETKIRYKQLISAMKRAEKRMNPVLNAFRDQVLFLKHNLNARAIASLQGELESVESDIASLIREMEVSIKEADDFIRDMQG